MNKPIYTPMVKSKRGEAKALTQLEEAVKQSIVPFFDVLALKAETPNGSDVHEHITKQAINIGSAWRFRGPCYVDLFDVTPSARGLAGTHPAAIIHEKLAGDFVDAIPVVGMERDIAYKMAIRVAVAAGASAIAVRLDAEDIQLPSMLAGRISNLLAELGATDLPLHVFMDFRSIEHVASDIVLAQATKAIAAVRKLAPARIIFAASAMVASMGAYKANTLNTLPRRDFLCWELLAKLHGDLDFADYGVVHPDYSDLDPRFIKPAAKIRYTADSAWIIVKGTSWRDNTSQHHELSKALAAKTHFRGDDCWGGEYIQSAAAGRPTYGSLETWVSIDQNNHVSHTVRQLAGVRATSTSGT